MTLSAPSPAHEATGIANNATLSWADSVGSDYYKVYFGTNSAEVTAKSVNVYRGNVTPKAYDPRLDLTYGAKYYWLITAIKAGSDDVDSDVWEFTIVEEAAGLPDAKKYKKKICSAANNKFFYDNDDSPPKQVELSGLTLDTSKAITMFELDQKVYIANDDILKVVDFVNTKLTLDSAMTVPPRRGQQITQANSNATMIIDYVAKGALTVIYGRTTSGTFTAEIAITKAENVGGTSVKFTAAGHPFQVDDTVQIIDTDDYNGSHPVTVIDGDTFTVVVTWVSDQQGKVGSGLSGDTMSPTTKFPSVVALPTTPHHYDWDVYADVTGEDEFGAMPPRATIGTRWRGRACLTGNSIDPHQWYKTRQMNPYDMMYGEDDEQAAVAGTDAKAGKVGDIITASIPYSDDYYLYGSIGDLWVLRGDPAAGGNLDKLIEGIGVISQSAWCFDDGGNLYFLDLKGMYRITWGLGAITPMTSNKIPNFTKDLALNPETQRIVLSFDPDKQGIVISVTTIETGANVNYFYDLQSGGFSPETYPVQDAIICSHYYDADDPEQRRLLFGSYDGHMRILDPAGKSDDIGSMASPASVVVDSYVLLGPVMIGGNHNQKGRMNSLTVVTAGGKAGGTVPDSDDIAYAVFVGDDAETVMEKADADTPIFGGVIPAPGRAKRIRRKARGVFIAVRLGNVATYVVTGTLYPDATGKYFYAGTYRGKPYYRREDGEYFIWWYSILSYWILSAAADGVLSAFYWYRNAPIVGEYEKKGTATGTPTVAASTEGKTWGIERVLAEIEYAGRVK